MKVVLAIDGGGSRTRCLAIDQHGHVVSRAETGPSNHLLVDKQVVAHSLAEAVGQSLGLAGLMRDDVACVSAGLAGVDFDGDDAPEMEAFLRLLGFENPVVNGDMTIAHAAALRLRPGVVALAGTGSVTLGVGADGERVKIGGWGPVYGDEGSAYRIGEMSLRAAARASDNRGPATALTTALLRELGLAEFRETVSRVYVDGMQPREIAALSRVAYEVAEAGDEVAREIFYQAGVDLAEAVAAALRRICLKADEKIVSYQGSVLQSCRLVRDRFGERLKESEPEAKVVAPEFEPVIGAYLLGGKALGWNIDEDVCGELKKFS